MRASLSRRFRVGSLVSATHPRRELEVSCVFHHRTSRRPLPRTRVWANREVASHGRPISARTTPPRLLRGVGLRGQRCVTPRQTCPRPKGLGRNLRSKTRWFTGFCNSHQVSHFATFFIDARAEISVAESRYVYNERTHRSRHALRSRGDGSKLSR